MTDCTCNQGRTGVCHCAAGRHPRLPLLFAPHRWWSHLKMRWDAAHLEFACRQAEARFDRQAPTSSEAVQYEADQALLARTRAALRQ